MCIYINPQGIYNILKETTDEDKVAIVVGNTSAGEKLVAHSDRITKTKIVPFLLNIHI